MRTESCSLSPSSLSLSTSSPFTPCSFLATSSVISSSMLDVKNAAITAQLPNAIVARYTTEYESLYALVRAVVAAATIVELLPGTADKAVVLPALMAVTKAVRELWGRPLDSAAAETSLGMLVVSLLLSCRRVC